ncbi:hypothetical protein HNY73_012116 [Argiope bruennichi]|uniref:C2H2-type domain-containing protein n=1 Tax=Argiope bruennichi TaxID=94029 RepID=A0A8T0EVH6_ARGBR|nr:hypothetical protein HNY73_012116 [Argiope bruennichi]
MTDPDVTDSRPINYDITDIASVSLAFFDIRNWYAFFLRMIKIGERFIAQCWNKLNVFSDSNQLITENSRNTCSVCGKRFSVDPQELQKRFARHVGSVPGGWVFVPNLEEYNPVKSSGTEAKGQSSRDHRDATTNSSSESIEPNATSSSLVFSTNTPVRSKTRSSITAKKPMTPKKGCVHFQKTPKSARRSKSTTEENAPLIGRRSKRQKKGN